MTTSIWAQQVVVLVLRLSGSFEQPPIIYEVVAEGGSEIEFGTNGISRSCVGFAQLKLGIRAVSSTGAPDEQTRRRPRPDTLDQAWPVQLVELLAWFVCHSDGLRQSRFQSPHQLAPGRRVETSWPNTARPRRPGWADSSR